MQRAKCLHENETHHKSFCNPGFYSWNVSELESTLFVHEFDKILDKQQKQIKLHHVSVQDLETQTSQSLSLSPLNSWHQRMHVEGNVFFLIKLGRRQLLSQPSILPSKKVKI